MVLEKGVKLGVIGDFSRFGIIFFEFSVLELVKVPIFRKIGYSSIFHGFGVKLGFRVRVHFYIGF